ncbi:hypothetical protein [Mesorhizobium salmacidum]|uniref:Uncharacterized protein n=1 Tax=Mesorhizobium salmacidum TaxID=3015171 RepID=A0ABU8KXQ1_9HYPH
MIGNASDYRRLPKHLNVQLPPIRAVEDGLRVGKGGSRTRLGNEAEFNDWLEARQPLDSVSAYSAARKAMTEVSDARVVLGGKMGLLDNPGDTYQGAMPGIIQEAIFCP